MAEAAKESTAKASGGVGGLLKKFKIPLAVVVIIGVQCGLAALFLPGSAAPQATADPLGDVDAAVEHELASEEVQASSEFREIDLGEFKLTSFRADSNSTWFIDFHLWGTIKVHDEEEFNTRFESAKNRLREQVLMIVRSMNRDDFADASLGLIKRQILEKSNKTLGKPLVRAVVFSDFSFVEQ